MVKVEEEVVIGTGCCRRQRPERQVWCDKHILGPIPVLPSGMWEDMHMSDFSRRHVGVICIDGWVYGSLVRFSFPLRSALLAAASYSVPSLKTDKPMTP